MWHWAQQQLQQIQVLPLQPAWPWMVTTANVTTKGRFATSIAKEEDVRSDQVVGTGIREIGIVVDQEALMDQVVLVDLDRRLEARRPRLSLEKGAFANWLGWEVLERVKWRCDDERLLGSLRLFGPPFFTPWQRLTGPPLRLFAACGSLGRWALRLTGPPLLWVSGSLGRCLAAALRAAASRLSGPRFGSGSMGRCIAALWAAVWQRLYGPLHRGSMGRCIAALSAAVWQQLYGPLHRGSQGRSLIRWRLPWPLLHYSLFAACGSLGRYTLRLTGPL